MVKVILEMLSPDVFDQLEPLYSSEFPALSIEKQEKLLAVEALEVLKQERSG